MAICSFWTLLTNRCRAASSSEAGKDAGTPGLAVFEACAGLRRCSAVFKRRSNSVNWGGAGA